MYDPKFRFALLVCLLVFFGTLAQILYSYILGPQGLNPEQYARGVPIVLASIVGGYFFIWTSTQLMQLDKYRKTGFEASYVDETGTGFNFPVSLSKYLPEIIAEPDNANLHPLESELIGFLNGFRTWPHDIDNPNGESLYTHSMKQWHAMWQLEGAGPLHRVAALAQDLGKVYTYKERRKTYPMSQFWKRDSVSFVRRCMEHGGYSAFVLSNMKSFREIGTDLDTNQRYRRALLTTIRYKNDPSSIPANCDPLSREIYEYIHMADQKAKITEGSYVSKFPPPDDICELFYKEAGSFFQSIVRDIEISGKAFTGENEGIYLGDGVVIIPMGNFIKNYTLVLSPEIRSTFNLWKIDNKPHAIWEYFIRVLERNETLVTTWEGIDSNRGLFNLRINSKNIQNCLILKIKKDEYPDLFERLDKSDKWTGLIELEQTQENLNKEIKEKASLVDNMLGSLNKMIMPSTS
jgi:hypothetical protein